MTRIRFVGIALSSILWVSGALAQDPAPLDSNSVLAEVQSLEVGEMQARNEFRSLDQDVQALKKEVLDLNRDLFLLEEELLFPGEFPGRVLYLSGRRRVF